MPPRKNGPIHPVLPRQVISGTQDGAVRHILGIQPVEVVDMVSSRGGKYGFVYKSRQRTYKALRRKGMSKKSAARISNGGRFHGQRSRMAKKGARTRKARGRR